MFEFIKKHSKTRPTLSETTFDSIPHSATFDSIPHSGRKQVMILKKMHLILKHHLSIRY